MTKINSGIKGDSARDDSGIRSRRIIIPDGYEPYLNLRQTEEGIRYIKSTFQLDLANALNLSRVSAPMFVLGGTGINDYLTGIERPVSFKVKDIKKSAEIVQSLAKWKRLALANYGFTKGEGLYTDMNAIRPDEHLDCLHSIYVDQWDWEKIIGEDDRNLDYLKAIVRKIYEVIKTAEEQVRGKYSLLPKLFLPEEIFFIHSEELEERFPSASPNEREDLICKEKGAVFIIGIGAGLKNGRPHDERAADYDDWSTETAPDKRGLNGDIIIWYPILNCAFELSSMGIRVSRESLLRQLKIKNEMKNMNLYYHHKLLNGELPQTIGGGIGQSRLCMFLLRKAHIGEVQSSVWPEEMLDECTNSGVSLL